MIISPVPSYGVQKELVSKANARRCTHSVSSDIAVALWERDGGGDIDYGRPEHHTLSVYVAGGRGVRCLSGKSPKESGRTGLLCVLPAERESRWTNTGYVSMLHVYFSSEAFERVTDSQIPISTSQTFIQDPVMYGIASTFVLGLDWNDVLNKGALEHAVFAMLNRISVYGQKSRQLETRGRLSRSDEGLVLQYVNDNLATHVSVPSIAAILAMSVRSASRRVRASFGLSPYQLVLRQRVDKAVEYIESGVPLADAATRCGFSSQSHMSRVIQKELGVTPRQLVR